MAEYIEREAAYERCGWYNTVNGKSVCAVRKDELAAIPAADVAPVEVVAQMFFDFTGDLCPCNYNGTDEWLPEVCELLNECPNPKGDKLACWKQYIKHWQPRMDGE